MGVNPKIIEKYSVYSIQTAREMALNIVRFTHASLGIGITGKLNKADPNNRFGCDNEVFVSIFYKDKYYDLDINVCKTSRSENKKVVLGAIIEKIESILYEDKVMI